MEEVNAVSMQKFAKKLERQFRKPFDFEAVRSRLKQECYYFHNVGWVDKKKAEEAVKLKLVEPVDYRKRKDLFFTSTAIKQYTTTSILKFLKGQGPLETQPIATARTGRQSKINQTFSDLA